MIYIVGLGAGDEDQLPFGIIKKLKEGLPIYLRTDQHPMISFFENNSIAYTSFDKIYERYSTFEEVYAYIIDFILKTGEDQDILYAVPGHPCVAEYTVKELMKNRNTKIVGGQSFLDAMFASLHIDPIDGLQIMDALSFEIEKVIPTVPLIVPQVFDQITASNLKLDLMELYPDEHLICIVCAAGSNQESLSWLPLYELDHDFSLNNLTTIFVPVLENNHL